MPSDIVQDTTRKLAPSGLAMKLFNTTDNIIGKTLEWKWASSALYGTGCLRKISFGSLSAGCEDDGKYAEG